MYVIVVYDVNVRRVSKVCNYLRRYLNWVQNSVFEGDLTESELERIKFELSLMINKEEDSIVIYVLGSDKYLKREIIGNPKNDISNIV